MQSFGSECRGSAALIALVLITAVVSTSVASAAPRGAGAAGCAERIAEFETIIESDHKTGNVAASVYRRITAELQPVKASCAAGQGATANARLSVIKSRHGYR